MSFFSFSIVVGWVVLPLLLTFCSYKKLAISETKTVYHHWTWYEAPSFIYPLCRQFLVGAVMRSAFYFYQSCHYHLQQFDPAWIGGHFTVP